MKKYLFLLLAVSLLTQCTKEAMNPSQTVGDSYGATARVQVDPLSHQMKNATPITSNHAFFQRLAATADYAAYNTALGTLDLNNIKLVTFYDFPNAKAVVVPIVVSSNVTGNNIVIRYMVSLFEPSGNTNLTFINEQKGVLINGEYRVEEDKYLTPHGAVVGGMRTIAGDKAGTHRHVQITPGPGAGDTPQLSWYEAWKECYDTQSENCSESPFCDALCSVFPCQVGWAFGCALQAFFV